MDKILNALHIAGYTANEKSFCVFADDGRMYWIENFSKQGIKKLLDNKIVDFPIKIHANGDNTAYISDGRIDNK